MRAWKLGLLAVLMAASLSTAHAQAKKEVRWGAATVGSMYYWDVFVAIELGYMDAEGVTVKVVNNETSVQSLQFLATNALDVTSVSTELVITAIDKGADFKLIGAENDRVAFVLVSRPEINSYQDLRGKTLGVTQLQETTATMIRLLLEKNGIKRNEYEMIVLGGSPSRYAALVRGAIAATMLSPPYDYKARADGMKKMGDAFEAFDGPGVVFAASSDWLKANPDAAAGFLRGIAKAQTFLHDPANKDRVIEIALKYMKIPREDMERGYESFTAKDSILSRTPELNDHSIKAWLDLRNSAEKPGRYFDMSYLKRAR